MTHASQVSVNGVTGPRANVNTRVESLIQEVKQVIIHLANVKAKEKMPFFIHFFYLADNDVTPLSRSVLLVSQSQACVFVCRSLTNLWLLALAYPNLSM
jgi:predicted DCC family thiol-disulfide oxidoreductase YuxK